MSFRFKPEDFEGCHDETDHIAHTANRLLDEHVGTLPILRAAIDLQFGAPSVWCADGLEHPGQIYRARLWDAQKIEPKKCLHPQVVTESHSGTLDPPPKAICIHCGTRLIARWEEADPKETIDDLPY